MTDTKKQEYFKDYYKKNINKFYEYNHNRPSQRKNYIGIEIDGITYCFPTKKQIKFIKIAKEQLGGDNIVLVN